MGRSDEASEVLTPEAILRDWGRVCVKPLKVVQQNGITLTFFER